MKTSSIIFFLLSVILLSCKTIVSKKYGSGATASISRLSLYKQNDSTIAPNVLWSQFDATKRSSLIAVMPESSKIKVRVLSENTPDAAIEAVNKITANLKNDKIEISAALEFSRNIAQIKRSGSVENYRTITYRIAEAVNNDGKIDNDLFDLYTKLIDATKSNNEKEMESSIKQSEKETMLAEVDLQKQKNIAVTIATLKEQLKDAKTDEDKKAIMKQIVELVK